MPRDGNRTIGTAATPPRPWRVRVTSLMAVVGLGAFGFGFAQTSDASFIESLSDYGIRTLDGEIKYLDGNRGSMQGNLHYVMSPQGNPAFVTFDGKHLEYDTDLSTLDISQVIWRECGSESNHVEKPHYSNTEHEALNTNGYDYSPDHYCNQAIEQEAATNDMARRLGFWSRDGIVRWDDWKDFFFIVSPQGNTAIASYDGKSPYRARSATQELDVERVTWLECVGEGLQFGDSSLYVPEPGYEKMRASSRYSDHCNEARDAI
ncbi:MAG: hypothetical protein DWQ08_07485, partial [Proteobacteria bacterium]